MKVIAHAGARSLDVRRSRVSVAVIIATARCMQPNFVSTVLFAFRAIRALDATGKVSLQ